MVFIANCPQRNWESFQIRACGFGICDLNDVVWTFHNHWCLHEHAGETNAYQTCLETEAWKTFTFLIWNQRIFVAWIYDFLYIQESSGWTSTRNWRKKTIMHVNMHTVTWCARALHCRAPQTHTPIHRVFRYGLDHTIRGGWEIRSSNGFPTFMNQSLL